MSEETTDQDLTNLEDAIDRATESVAVQAAEIGELAGATDANGDPIGMDALMEVPVRVTVRIGRANLTLGGGSACPEASCPSTVRPTSRRTCWSTAMSPVRSSPSTTATASGDVDLPGAPNRPEGVPSGQHRALQL